MTNRFLLASPDADFEQRVRRAYHGTLNGELRLVHPTSAIDEFVAPQDGPAAHPEVLVLGPEVATDEALEVAALIDRRCPEVPVVLVAAPDPSLWQAALRAGVRDVLAPDASDDVIRTVLDRASQTAVGRRRAVRAQPAEVPSTGGRVTTVASPKGGSGKTTIASNLAVGLASRDVSTVLVDLDLQFGDVASALGVTPEHTLSDVLGAIANRDAMALKAFLVPHRSGSYLLCAPESPAVADRITSDHVIALLELLASEFDRIVIDTAPGLTEVTLAAIEHADDLVLVCGMDVPSVRGMRKELDVLDELELTTAHREIVLNLVDTRGGLSTDDVESVLGGSTRVRLPRSSAVQMSTNEGVPLLEAGAKGVLARELDRLVESLATTGTSADPGTGARPRRGLLARWRDAR